MLIVCASLTFVAVSEFFFWNEFASRFNFIAVDYLIYTREVIGNIRESYDLRPAFIGIGLITVGLFYTQWRGIKGASNAPVLPWRKRFIGLAIIFALPVLSFFLINWLVEVTIFHTRRPPQRACACHIATVGGSAGTINRHDSSDAIQ